MVSIKELAFRYPRTRFELRVKDLRIAAGEKVAFVGPSGSGKTTLLNLIAGITVADQGEVSVFEKRIDAMGDRARRDFRISRIGMVFQQFELVPYLAVRENIRLPYLINQSIRWDAACEQRFASLVAETGLSDKQRRFPSQLSQGEQQRVAIARALINEPDLILADEPTGNLDLDNKRRILQLLFEQLSRDGRTLIVVTHDTGILDGFDRVIDFAGFHGESSP